ncbi:MAG: T9SS type A sorting domain-containing protein [Lewinellaceae bacterium]|nr:T9SS type A sorting domain-containing protein [Lewinellaceae bacterium]
MRQHFLIFCLIIFVQTCLSAQIGCPGCALNLPAGLPVDTLYLPPLPDGEKGTPYDEDISFRVPKTTTPVHAVDSTTPPGLTISKIEIVSIEGMPPGLFWEASQVEFETALETDGCIKVCGTPFTSDSFVMTVNLKATVFIFTQETSFPIRLYVAPKVSTNDGFTMENVTGCGSTTVTFTNNNPSNGNSGFTYEWNFGDSTSYSGENPPPHTYDKPGLYEVNYHATIDTVGYILVSATVLGVDCVDQLGVGVPDLYLFINNQSGMQLYNSSPHIDNTPLPYTFPINLPLTETAIYSLEVWDEDSGLKGGDDPCGSVAFNFLSTDTLSGSGAFRIILNIQHPVDEIFSTDTVIVYPKPAIPKITANKLATCEGSDTIVLESSFGDGNQWFVNGHPIAGETDFLFMPDSTGYYQVQAQNTYGCTSISDSTFVEFYPLPAVPTYVNDRNNLKLLDTLALPANYSLQWYLFNAPIAGATGFTHCAQVNGEYSLIVTDLNTGCTNTYATTVTIDPNFDCTIGAKDVVLGELNIFPNPASGLVTVQMAAPLSENGTLRVWDVAGRLVQTVQMGAGADQIQVNAGNLNPGMYFLELSLEGRRYVGSLAVLR